jgi:beta-mannosidase
MSEQHISRVLSKGWKFRSSGSTEWRSAKVPSEVHTELLRHKRIPDPFVGLNELRCAWVAEKAWHYRTEFPTPSGVSDSDDTTRVDLVFEGLDTFATVLLNGVVILESDNMFLSHRVDVAGVVHRDRSNHNTLEIVFAPAREAGLELVKAHSEHEFIVHQTEVSRGPVRKAQYHWGWDWGPILLTCGPWRPVRLETYQARIEDVRVDYDVDLSGEQPAVTMRFTVAAAGWPVGGAGETSVAVVSLDGEGLYLSGALEAEDGAGGKETAWKCTLEEVRISNAKLWWPRGYGDQQMYRVRIQLIRHGIVLDDREHVCGFRKVELVQEADGFGQSFYFRINGVDVFCGGSCWIPADSFVSRITPDRYKRWIQMMAEGNQNMVRVWGGGIYESTAFYEACDELGIMVWQDFMFACASYPTYPSFLKSVEAEARDNLQRIRRHPSVVLWCGNNEDYQLIERYNLEYNFDTDKDPQSWLKSTFPARYIYEHLLPAIVKVESPWTIYHPGSPWGNGRSTTLEVDPTVGDIHQWNMWHGDMRKLRERLSSLSRPLPHSFPTQT